MIKIRSADLIISVPSLTLMPETGLPEIALLGRSNVGKSSLINALLGRKSLARTSSQPGKTRLFNFYLINEQFYLVDMPGYGYARFAQSERQRLRNLIYTYLEQRHTLKLVIHTIDFRHDPSKDDIEFSQILRQHGVPFVVVATKSDKVPRSKHIRHQRAIAVQLGIPVEQVLITSAEIRQGLDPVWSRLLSEDDQAENN